jgi:hypothetical protein
MVGCKLDYVIGYSFDSVSSDEGLHMNLRIGVC